MKSVTLTKSMRHDILVSIIDKWKEKNPVPKLEQAEHDFAMYLWNDYFKKQKPKLKDVPRDFMRLARNVKFCVNGEVGEVSFLEEKEMPRNWESSYNSPVLKTVIDSNKEYCKYKKVKDAHSDWLEKGREIQIETKAILESVNTTRQLLELWEQCEPFLPAYIADPDKAIKLPAIKMSRLNERIGL